MVLNKWRGSLVPVEQFYLAGLGHQSYLVSDEASEAAAVIDPRRDVAGYLEAAERHSVRITHILETHLHNDYVSGARELAAKTDATIVFSAAGQAAYAQRHVHDGDRVAVGALTFQVLATPGHTPEHVSYALSERTGDPPSAIFTGGSLLAAGIGRTDLLGPKMTIALTRQQYHSVRRLLTTMPGEAIVYPTHGSGSFCGAQTIGSLRSSTIAAEVAGNPVMLARDEGDFVRSQPASYGEFPAYYAHMRALNQAGPRILGDLPVPAAREPSAVWEAIRNGTPLIDGRRRDQFAAAHIPGSLNIESSDEDFATYIGWLLPFNTSLMLLIVDEEGRREAVVQLIRIGYERVEGYVAGGFAAWEAAALPVERFAHASVPELARRLKRGEPLSVADVRREAEWREGHVPDAIHVHIGDLPSHLASLPTDRPIATICRSGFRAAIAASMIAATGREVISIDGGMPDWQRLGLPVADDASAVDMTAEAHQHL
jgi:hydroxyacylglutathione hydrolase